MLQCAKMVVLNNAGEDADCMMKYISYLSMGEILSVIFQCNRYIINNTVKMPTHTQIYLVKLIRINESIFVLIYQLYYKAGSLFMHTC